MAQKAEKSDFQTVRQIHSVLVMHFIEGRTQADIAASTNMSHAKVNRLIKQGREMGMLQITINSPYQRLAELEKSLADQWNLQSALVTPTVSGSAETTLQQVGSAAATMLLETIRSGDTIAISGGKAVSAVVENLSVEKPLDVQVVPLTGGVQGKHYTDVNHVATLLAEKLGGTAMLVHAPLFAETEAQRDMLMNMGSIKPVFDLARSANVALVGVGSILTPQSSYYDLHPMSAEERQALISMGAVCEFLAHIIDAEGRLCETELNSRLVALRPEDVLSIPTTIAVASGDEKIRPIQAALNGGYLKALVVDEATAQSVTNTRLEIA